MAIASVPTPASDLAETAAELLPLARDAARSLAREPGVPADMPAVIEKLAKQLPSVDQWAGVDGYLAAALSEGVIRCYRALQNEGETSRSELRVGLEQIQQALTYLVDERHAADTRSTAEIVTWLLESTGASREELGKVLDVSSSTVSRWVSGSTPSADDGARLRAVARVVTNLRHSLTPPGVLLWFRSPHPDLDGRAPMDLLDTPHAYPSLVRLASRTRSSVAT